MRKNYYFLFLFISFLFISENTSAQTANFDETWKEFLENNKISNMSQLVRPDKAYNMPNYAKYLLMNTNTNFCQSKIEIAEEYMTEVQAINPLVYKPIVGYVAKMNDIDAKMKAYHSMDDIWKQFLVTKEVSLEELEAVEAAKTSCEKSTLAKYSYMTAYYYLCQGEVIKAKNIFENRTLRLAEKTTLRIKDVEGLADEVAKMKSLFQNLDQLDTAWGTYIETGVSPGFDEELPLFLCYPIPNMKEYILKGTADVCNSGPEMIEKIKDLETKSGVTPDAVLNKKVKALEVAIRKKESSLANLNKTWKAFVPENRVTKSDYGYDFCNKEALIRAYIMDGFAFVCEMAEESLEKIDALQRSDFTELDEITMLKIKELSELNEQYQYNGVEIEELWNTFTSQGDTLYQNFISIENYCDNIHQVKDWIIGGNCGTCEEKNQYLENIESFQRTFEFSFTEELECQVQNLRVKLWDCRYKILEELASIEVSTNTYEERLEEYKNEYGMGDRPEVCVLGE